MKTASISVRSFPAPPLMKELNLQRMINAYLREERKEKRQRRGWYVTDLGQRSSGIYLQRVEGTPGYDGGWLRIFSVGNKSQERLVDKAKRAAYQVLAGGAGESAGVQPVGGGPTS